MTNNNAQTRRRFLKATTGAATLTGLAGCIENVGDGGGQSPGPGTTQSPGGDQRTTTGTSRPTELRVWGGSATESDVNRKWWKGTTSDFDEQHPDINFKFTGVPYDPADKKIAAAAAQGADALPHAYETGSTVDVVAAAEPRLVTDLYNRSKVKEQASGALAELPISMGQVATGQEGETIGITVATRPYVHTYRKEWLDAAGWDVADVDGHGDDPPIHEWRGKHQQLYEDMKGTDLGQRDGYFPSATGCKESDEEYLPHYIPQHGGSRAAPLDPLGTHCILTNDPARRAFQLQVDFIDQGLWHENAINQGDEEHSALIWANKLGEIHVQDVSDVWGEFQSNKPKVWSEGRFRFGLMSHAGTQSTFGTNPTMWAYEAPFQNSRQEDAYLTWCDWFGTSGIIPPKEGPGWLPLNADKISSDALNEKGLIDEEADERFWGNTRNILANYQIGHVAAVPGADAIQFAIPFEMHQRILQQGESIESATENACQQINDVLREHDRYQAP